MARRTAIGYWSALFRFGIPLVLILGILRYFDVRRNPGVGQYSWKEGLLVGGVLVFIAPAIFVEVLRFIRTKKHD